MTVHFKSISKMLGALMMLISTAMFLPVFTGIFYAEYNTISALSLIHI